MSDTQRPAGRLKIGTGAGAALSVLGVLGAIQGTEMALVGLVGALALGVGLATEWR